MSHASQLKFVELVFLAFPEHFTGSRVLEVGSLDINGSVRKFFRGWTTPDWTWPRVPESTLFVKAKNTMHPTQASTW